jgi:cobalamin biosynthesis Co2+ chelatase CbiK
MSTITMRIPDDLITDLKRVAPHKGFSGYQPLIRAYIGQGLREDLSTLDSKPEITKLIKSLKKQGVTESALTKAMIEAGVMVQNQ